MDSNVIIGFIVTIVSICIVVGLYVWSTRIIDHMHNNKIGTMRQKKANVSNGDSENGDSK